MLLDQNQPAARDEGKSIGMRFQARPVKSAAKPVRPSWTSMPFLSQPGLQLMSGSAESKENAKAVQVQVIEIEAQLQANESDRVHSKFLFFV